MLELLLSAQNLACSVCFGNPEAPLTKGLAAGVMMLGGVIAAVLCCFMYFFIRLWIRARRATNLSE